MSRSTGPRVKVLRALGVDIPGFSAKSMERRPYPPGQHGHERKKTTEYARRLKEKQKLRVSYGVTERQLSKLMSEARSAKVATGDKLIELLERRLDNAVFRAGFARTIPAARQLVRHGHIQVNGRRVDIPSFRIQVGQTISLREKSKTITPVETGLAAADRFQTAWLAVDREARSAKVTALPESSSILFPIELQLVVEYYSQRL